MVSLFAMAGNRYSYNLSGGGVTITATNTGHTLVSGDSVFFTSSSAISDITPDATLNGIFLDFSACAITHLKSGGLYQLTWACTNCTIRGINALNWYVNIRMHQTHNNRILKWHVQNTGANISDAPLLQWDYPYNTDMVYTGLQSQTFYHETVDSCYFDGFKDVSGVFTAGGNWNGTTNTSGVTEDNRSFLNNFTCNVDSFLNISSTSGANSIYAIAGTGFGCKINNPYFLNIDGPGSFHHSHNAAVLWYGSIIMSNPYIASSYASVLRNYNSRSTVFGGVYANDTSAVEYGLGKDFLSYSFAEGNRSTSDMGNRNHANGFYSSAIGAYYCTVDSTTVNSYNGTWHGRIMDFVNEDTGKVIGCVIFRPELDNASTNFSSDSTAANGFFYIDIGSATAHKTIANNYSARYSTGKVQDSITYMPTATSPLRNRGTTHTDRFGTVGNDIGYINYINLSPPTIGPRQTIYYKKKISSKP